MSVPFVLCDVFADQPFSGNQLAVILGDVPEAAMLSLAREFDLSEVTFVTSSVEESAPTVRIWTPAGELPFAGHPTVGTTVVLAAEGRLELGPATLRLGIGEVDVEVLEFGPGGGRASMIQHVPSFGETLADRSGLAEAVGLDDDSLAPNLPIQVVSTGLPHLMVPMATLNSLERAEPRPELINLISPLGLRAAYLFTTDTPGTAAAARARLIAPGKREDPATGSAAGPLGAYLVRYGLHRAGELEIEQGIQIGRPSRIEVDVPVIEGEIGPVRVAGRVQIWGRGQLYPRL